MIEAIPTLPRRIVNRLRREMRAATPDFIWHARFQRLRSDLERNRVRPANLAADPRPIVVFFAPAAGIVPHYAAQCLLAKTLQERDHRVLIVGCSGIYPRCIVMDGTSLPFDASPGRRQSTCIACGTMSMDMTGRYGLDVVDVAEFLSEDVEREIDALLAHLPDDLSTYRFEGHRFGEICGAEAAVTFKSADLKGETPAVRALLVRYLKGALLSYRAMQCMVERLPIARLVYFSEYAIHLGAVLAARGRDIPTVNMQIASLRGADHRRIILMPELLAIMSYRHRLERWPVWRALALPAEAIAEIGDDCIYRISSNSAMVYSPVRTGGTDALFEKLKLAPDRRVLVAFTSSLDEIEANKQYLKALNFPPFGQKQPFRDQIEWLEALAEVVESSKDLQLVVRIHPREGSNRREKIKSYHLELLRQKFGHPYRHVRFVWPEDPVSSYDLMELADVGLSSWSSTALEMARFGLPTVVAFDHHTPFPVGDVVTWRETRDGYFNCLKEALTCPPSLDLVAFAFRWSFVRSMGCVVDLKDVIPRPGFHGIPDYTTPHEAQAIEDIFIRGTNPLDINEARLQSNQGPQARLDETEAIKRQLRRIVWLLCFGEDRDDDYRLTFSASSDTAPADRTEAVVIDAGECVEMRSAGRKVRRRSRLVRRLAPLAAQTSVADVT